MYSTESGIVTERIAVVSKAWGPMYVTESPMVAEVSSVQT